MSGIMDTTVADKALKEFYLPNKLSLLNTKAWFYNRIKKNSKDVEGREAVIDLQDALFNGLGARAEGGALPTWASPSWQNTLVPMKYNYNRGKISGQIIAAAKSDKGAFIKGLSSMTEGMSVALIKDLNRQCFGNGTGLLTTNVGAGTATSTIITVLSTKYIKKGMTIDFKQAGTTTDVTNGANLLVTNVTSSTTFTIAATDLQTMTTLDEVYIADNQRLEMMGLAGIVSASDPWSGKSLQGLAVATYPDWKSGSFLNGGTNRDLSTDLLEQAFEASEITNGGEVSLILTSHAGRRAYLNYIQPDRRFTGMDLDAGSKKKSFNGMEMMVDVDCPANRYYFLDEQTLAIYRMSNIAWMDRNGGILQPVVGYDQYEAVMYVYCEMGTNMRNRNTLLGDISM